MQRRRMERGRPSTRRARDFTHSAKKHQRNLAVIMVDGYLKGGSASTIGNATVGPVCQ